MTEEEPKQPTGEEHQRLFDSLSGDAQRLAVVLCKSPNYPTDRMTLLKAAEGCFDLESSIEELDRCGLLTHESPAQAIARWLASKPRPKKPTVKYLAAERIYAGYKDNPGANEWMDEYGWTLNPKFRAIVLEETED